MHVDVGIYMYIYVSSVSLKKIDVETFNNYRYIMVLRPNFLIKLGPGGPFFLKKGSPRKKNGPPRKSGT